MAGRVRAENVQSVFVLAGQVQGNVKSVFTLWTALAVGVGVGVALFGLRTWANALARPATRAGARSGRPANATQTK